RHGVGEACRRRRTTQKRTADFHCHSVSVNLLWNPQLVIVTQQPFGHCIQVRTNLSQSPVTNEHGAIHHLLSHLTQRIKHTADTDVADCHRSICDDRLSQLTHHRSVSHVAQRLYKRLVIQTFSPVQDNITNVFSSFNLTSGSATMVHSG